MNPSCHFHNHYTTYTLSCQHIFVSFLYFLLFLNSAVLSQATPGRDSARKAPAAHPKPGYAVGEETRTGTGPRPHAGQQQDRRRHDPDPATTPGSTAGSPGGAEDTPRPRQQAQQADPHRLDLVDLVDLVDNATAPTPATIDSRTAPRPATAPTAPRQRTPSHNAIRHTHAAQDAHRTRQRRPTTIYTHQQRQPATAPHAGQADSRTDSPRPPTIHKLSKEQTPHDIHVNVLKKYDNWHISIDNHTITCIMVYSNTITCKSPHGPRPRPQEGETP